MSTMKYSVNISSNSIISLMVSCNTRTYSVRAMQYILDMAENTKISDDLAHELSFK